VVRVLRVGDDKIRVFIGKYRTFDVLFVRPHGRHGLGRCGRRIIILIIRKLSHEEFDEIRDMFN
jgi:hypothetical protein